MSGVQYYILLLAITLTVVGGGDCGIEIPRSKFRERKRIKAKFFTILNNFVKPLGYSLFIGLFFCEIEGGSDTNSRSSFRLAWLAVSRRRRRTVISVVLLSFVIGSSITVGSTIGQFPTWISALSTSSPTVLLSYERTSPVIGLLPANSTVSLSDMNPISQISGVTSVTPLIIKDLPTSLSTKSPSLVVGLDINFWQLSLGLNSGHWPKPNSTEAVITEASVSGAVPATVTINNVVFSVVGVALTSNLVLVGAIVVSYTTAQDLFSLERSTSVFVIQVDSLADPGKVSTSIDQADPSLATVDLSSSAAILGTVTRIVGTISNTVVLAEAVFAFAILATLSVSSINARRWEYGLVSSYGGRRSAIKMVLIESWIVFALAVVPTLLIGIGILGYFTYYFNALFGVSLSPGTALGSALFSATNATTLLNYVAALVATTLGSVLAIRVGLPKFLSRTLADQQN